MKKMKRAASPLRNRNQVVKVVLKPVKRAVLTRAATQKAAKTRRRMIKNHPAVALATRAEARVEAKAEIKAEAVVAKSYSLWLNF